MVPANCHWCYRLGSWRVAHYHYCEVEMDKEERDKLRKILEFNPGDIVPLPGTGTIIQLLDQIDNLEKAYKTLVDTAEPYIP